MPRAIIVVGVDGRIRLWNKAAEELYGWAESEVLGQMAVDLLSPPEQVSAHVERMEEAVEGAPYSGDRILRRKDGGSIHIFVDSRAMLDDDGEVVAVVGASEDITVMRRLEAEALAAVEQERIHRERLELLMEVNDALARANTRQEIMANVVRSVVPRLADWCSIHVLPEPNAVIPEVETYHVDPEMVAFARDVMDRHPYDPEAVTGVPEIMRTGQAQFFPFIDATLLDQADLDDGTRGLIEWLALRSGIGVPLIKRGRVVGVLQLAMTHSRRNYTQDDFSLAQAVAGRVASSLDNRRLAEQQQMIAITLQESLLPDHLPHIAGVDAAVRYWAVGEGTEVGGDFYDLFPNTDDSWVAVIGDICGTGPTAAALTGLARHTIRQSAWRADDPASVLRWLNRAMLESTQNGFLTVAYFEMVRRGSGFLVDLAVGGHPLPVVVKADGTASFVGEPGTLVGAFEKIKVNPVAVDLEPGDTLVLYTDGVSDLAPPHGLSEDQVLDLMADCVQDSDDAEGTADCLHTALADILPLDQRADDIALLVLRVDPVG